MDSCGGEVDASMVYPVDESTSCPADRSTSTEAIARAGSGAAVPQLSSE